MPYSYLVDLIEVIFVNLKVLVNQRFWMPTVAKNHKNVFWVLTPDYIFV